MRYFFLTLHNMAVRHNWFMDFSIPLNSYIITFTPKTRAILLLFTLYLPNAHISKSYGVPFTNFANNLNSILIKISWYWDFLIAPKNKMVRLECKNAGCLLVIYGKSDKVIKGTCDKLPIQLGENLASSLIRSEVDFELHTNFIFLGPHSYLSNILYVFLY